MIIAQCLRFDKKWSQCCNDGNYYSDNDNWQYMIIAQYLKYDNNDYNVIDGNSSKFAITVQAHQHLWWAMLTDHGHVLDEDLYYR